MTARRREPPAFAIWLLQHCAPSHTRDALLGDVLEKFHRGESAGWVWREAFSSLLWVVARGWRPHAGEIAFALVGTALAELWWRSRWASLLWRSYVTQNLFGWGVGWPLPLSTMYDLTFVSAWRFLPLLPLLMVFWYRTGPWHWARILGVILVGFVVSMAENLVVVLLPHGRYWFLTRTSVFLVLLICAVISRKPVTSSRPAPF